jgi:N-acetyl-gamma-glutamyl-phosphate reductase
LLELERGILVTAYVRLKKEQTLDGLRALYQARYMNEPFVHLEAKGALPDLKQVRGTNDCRIGISLDSRTGRAVVVATEDNLGKGAALQAVQNMNLMLGLDEAMGLRTATAAS